MTITLRNATPADAERFIALQRQLYSETEFMLYAPADYDATPESVAGWISRVEKSSSSRIIVASDADEIVGFIGVMGTDIPRRRHAAQIVVGVLRAYWGRGIGKMLFDEAARWAGTEGISRLELGVMTHNARAIALYVRQGFGIEGTRRRAYFIDGKPADEHVMARIVET